MEKEILQIIQRNSAGSTELITDGLYYKIAMREIASMVMEFVEWVMTNVFTYHGEYFIYPLTFLGANISADMKFCNIKELFEYWNKNVRNQ